VYSTRSATKPNEGGTAMPHFRARISCVRRACSTLQVMKKNARSSLWTGGGGRKRTTLRGSYTTGTPAW